MEDNVSFFKATSGGGACEPIFDNIEIVPGINHSRLPVASLSFYVNPSV